MSPPKKKRFDSVFEAIQAIGTLTFFCSVWMLVFISDGHSQLHKLIFVCVWFPATILICLMFAKQWKFSTVLWFLFISAVLSFGVSLMV